MAFSCFRLFSLLFTLLLLLYFDATKSWAGMKEKASVRHVLMLSYKPIETGFLEKIDITY